MSGPSIVVLGGGLAGVAAAKGLGRHGLPVVLVDHHDYHQFQPMLYQVATAQLPAEDIARPLRTIFAEHPSVEVVTAHVETAKLSDRSLTFTDGQTRGGDFLVVAAGARPNFFGIPGAAQHSYPLYSVADAERLRLHLQHILRGAQSDDGPEADPADAPGALDIVVVGAGATGVETAGATAELLRAFAREGRLRRTAQVVLVDRGKALLPQFSPKAHDYAYEKLTEAGVQVRLGVGVASVRPDGVDLDDGTAIPTRTVVWAGGEAAADIVQAAGMPPGRGGRIDVRPDLRVPGLPGVYAVGDVANIPDGSSGSQAALPQLGSVAQQAGGWAAANILREIDGKEPHPFHYKDKGIMAMIGRNAAVAEVGRHRHQVEGPVAFAAWLGVHAMLLSGVHSKSDAFLSWAWDYFDRDHAAVVESHAAPQRIAWGDDTGDVPHIVLDDPAS
jgi:NADH dehydrogenase